MPTRRGSLAALAAILVAAFLAAAPAHAAQVIVVGGEHASRVEDPAAPPASQVDPGPPPRVHRRARPWAVVSSRSSRKRVRAVLRTLRRALRRHRISRARYRSYRAAYGRARGVRARLRGARRRQLGYVIGVVERFAVAHRLIPSRMPLVFLELRRNTQYWRSKPYPAPRDWVRFRGSELLFQYFPGRGLQLHPLGTFKRANLLHAACGPPPPAGKVPRCDLVQSRPPGRGPCQRERLRHLLDAMAGLAVHRGPGFIAWEYTFDFGGGSPPWISAMAEAEGLKAFARGGRLLGRPDYFQVARRALGAFERGPRLGVRTRGPLGGVAYLQYSFAPRLYIFNAFFDSVMGLHDFAKLTGDERTRRLFQQAEPEARREVPHSDTGRWSLYSWRGPLSDRNYHELLREVLQGLGVRLGGIYCDYAMRYRRYQQHPPRGV